MPARLGTSGSVRASSTAKLDRWAQVVHTFCPVITQSSPSRSARVASDARSDPEPGSLKSWHQRLLVAHDRRQEAKPLLLGPVGEERRRGQVQSQRVEAAEVVRPQLLVDPARHVAAPGRARRSRPARSATTSPDAPNTGYHASYSARLRTVADLGRAAPAPRRRPRPGGTTARPSRARHRATSSTGESGPDRQTVRLRSGATGPALIGP